MSERKSRWVKLALNVLLLVLAFSYVGFTIADRFGVWDHLFGIDLVEQAATNFESSFIPETSSKPVRVGDKEWEPLLKLTYQYSKAQFPTDKQPRVFARYKALLAARTPPDSTIFSEWTAPSTPLFLIYRDWPGNDIPKEDFRVIGTIGDLRDWISKAKDYRRFMVQDVFLGTFTPLLGFALFLIDWKTERRDVKLPLKGTKRSA